jgi:hypothetical protein
MTMLKRTRTTLTLAALALAASAVASEAMAATQWQKDHPRRTEVKTRLGNQDRRIHNEVKSGQITRGQARQLHREDHAIRGEERTMASTNDGHLTGTEQRALNQQENQVSRQIGK